ncbi:Uncharacterized protein APZ42_025555 [Daphnia magna]|uniref:DUF5641 domain-containing protein n=1 Tax=Daphnia magna TaxID=35525 RepID=A0A164SYT2_9CRUS|nr:Uncharacterized protein APZ42_025555 [Daphnia magna]
MQGVTYDSYGKESYSEVLGNTNMGSSYWVSPEGQNEGTKSHGDRHLARSVQHCLPHRGYPLSIARATLPGHSREYVSDISERFVTDYLLQIDKFHCKGGPSRKIRIGEVVIIHDDNTKRLMWTIGVVKEIIPSRDGLIRSVMVKTPNGNLINHAIQSLYPLELREDQPDDVEVPPTPELELEPEEATPPVSAADPVEQEEPWTTGSGGECVGNTPDSQHPTTRAGRRTRLPQRFLVYDFGGPR